jgi:hypothetical protein
VFCCIESNFREFLGRRREFVAFEEEKKGARLKACSLIAVDEGVSLDDRLHKRCGLREGCWKTLLSSETGFGTCYRCRQGPDVAKSWHSAIQCNDVVVKEEDVFDCDRTRAASHLLESSRRVERYFLLK